MVQPLSPLQAKLLRLALDNGATDGESLAALTKLRVSLGKDGPQVHELCDALQSAGFALPEEAPLPPAPTKPNYGLCVIPFGKNKGTLFMDSSPYELRRIKEWCLDSPDKAQKFASLIHDIEAFLSNHMLEQAEAILAEIRQKGEPHFWMPPDIEES
jgi:hypothetical protein